MTDDPGSPGNRQTARTYSAASKTTKGLSPLDWGDKCFLCGKTIAEAAPRGFHAMKNSQVLCHRGCIDTMMIAGGHPRDFHRVMEARNQPPVHDKPVHQDVEAAKAVVLETIEEYKGPRSIKFDSLPAMQTYIAAKGPIPDFVRVAIGAYVIQAGG